MNLMRLSCVCARPLSCLTPSTIKGALKHSFAPFALGLLAFGGSARANAQETFPSAAIGATRTQTVTVTITTAGNVGGFYAVTQGTINLDFTATTGGTCTTIAYTVGQTCTVNVAFTPKAAGLRTGGLVVTNSGGTILGQQRLTGTGTGPLARLAPTTSTVINSTVSLGRGLTVDAAGNIYVANAGSHNVFKFAAGSTTPTTIATGFTDPVATAVDGFGNVFFNDGNQGFYEIVVGTTTPVQISTIALSEPNLALDTAGNLYSTDNANTTRGSILKIDAVTHAKTVLYDGTGAGHRFVGMAIDPSGNLFAADLLTSALYELPAGASTLTLLYAGAPLNAPSTVAIDPAGDIYVINNGGGSIMRFAAGNYTGTPYTTSSTANGALAFGGDGTIYAIVDSTNQLIAIRPSALSLNLGSAALGTTVSNITGLTNDGNAPLIISIPASGANPAFTGPFALATASSNPCATTTSASTSPGTLAAGGLCNLAVTFTPIAAGPSAGSAIHTDNSLTVAGSTQTITLGGTGVAAPATKLAFVPTLPNTATLGSTLTITVAAQSAGGITNTINTSVVTLNYGGNGFSTTFTATTVNGVATFNVTPISAYAYTFSATANGLTSTPTVTVIIAAPAPANVLTGPTSSFLTASVTFTDTVSSAASTPTGSVRFMDGVNTLATVTLVNGVATYTTSTLTLGAHPITAVYLGDPNFTTVTSNTVTNTIADFSVTFDGGAATRVQISPLGTATYAFTLAPLGTPALPGLVTLTATGVPSNYTVVITPRTVPAGSGSTSFTVAITAPAFVNTLFKQTVGWAGIVGGLLFLPLLFRRKLAGRMPTMLGIGVILLLTGAISAVTGCSSASPNPQSFVVTVTGTDGALSHSTPVGLTVVF